MTKFVRDSFSGTEYVNYSTPECTKFVARFKYAKGSKASFLTFLTKNFTVEEYFSRLDKGESPLTILQSKGFIQPHIKKMLKEQGYPVTPAGFEQLVQDNVAKRYNAWPLKFDNKWVLCYNTCIETDKED